MKKRRSKGADDDGDITIYDPPKIDLPPGVVWPNDPQQYLPMEEDATV